MSNRDYEKDIEHLTLVIDTLRNERDEARREVCELSVKTEYQENYAKGRGWDCFKDNP